jgi:iron complex outermembrane recepter protein
MLIAKYRAGNSMSRNWDDARLRSVRATIALLGAAALSLSAQVFAETPATGERDLDQVIVTGSRQTGIKASDSAAPIQIVGAEALRAAGAPDLMSALSTLVPSLQMQAFGFDMSGQTLQARLRGVSPNDVSRSAPPTCSIGFPTSSTATS